MKFEIVPVREVATAPTRTLLRELFMRAAQWLAYLRWRYSSILGLAAVCFIAFISFFAGKTSDTSVQYDDPSQVLEDLPRVQALVEETRTDPLPQAVEVSVESDAAPISEVDIPSDPAKAYILRYAKTAVTEMRKYGVPASISLAQGLIESRYGTSTLARENNNHFGIKCHSRNCKKGHCSNFSDDSHKDFFRKYKTAWESWRAHSEILSSGRYAKLKKYGRDYRKWAQGLKTCGYATDRTYATKLIKVIEKYDLHRYDK